MLLPQTHGNLEMVISRLTQTHRSGQFLEVQGSCLLQLRYFPALAHTVQTENATMKQNFYTTRKTEKQQNGLHQGVFQWLNAINW